MYYINFRSPKSIQERSRKRNGRFVFTSTHTTRRRMRKTTSRGTPKLSTTPELRTTHSSIYNISFFNPLLLLFTLSFKTSPSPSADSSYPTSLSSSLLSYPSLKRSQKPHSCTSYCCFHFVAPPHFSRRIYEKKTSRLLDVLKILMSVVF